MSGVAIPCDELQSVIGEGGAAALLAAFGGTRLYVPGRLTPDHPITKAIGVERAAMLSRHLAHGRGGLHIELPRGDAGLMGGYRKRLRELAADPRQSAKMIARDLGITERTVGRMRATLRQQTKVALGAPKHAAARG